MHEQDTCSCGELVYAKGFCRRCYHRDYQRRNRDQLNQSSREWSRRNAEKSREIKRRYREKVNGPSRRIPRAVQDALFERGLRLCTDCQQELPLAEFSRQRSRRHGYVSQCKACHNAYARAWREANLERVREHDRSRKPPALTARQRRALKYRSKFGIDISEFDALLVDQNHRCAICLRQISADDRRTHLDHCHQTGAIRGVLCNKCNMVIGLAGENSETLIRAAAYVDGHIKEGGIKMGQISLTIPQIGQPDTTQDPLIQNAFTTIQNVINGGLDTNNLSPTAAISNAQLAVGSKRLNFISKSANYTAVAGDFVYASPNVTVTLPAATSNATVAIMGAITVTGAAPATVAGSLIYGVGLNNVSSFTLGTPISFAVLQSDGTNWFIVGGQQDTGWVALGYATGWATTAGCYAAAVRVIGDRAYLRGTCTNSSGSNSGSPFAAALPAAARPASKVTFPAAYADSGFYAAASVTSAGVFACTDFVSNGTTLGLDGTTYSLS